MSDIRKPRFKDQESILFLYYRIAMSIALIAFEIIFIYQIVSAFIQMMITPAFKGTFLNMPSNRELVYLLLLLAEGLLINKFESIVRKMYED